MKRSVLFIALFTLFCAGEIHAQISNEFQIASRLMQQQRYEQALPMFQRVYDREPTVFQYFSGLVDCHIQLKQYETAEALAKLQSGGPSYPALASVLLGKIRHMQGNEAEARTIWQQNLERNPNQLQVYINTANTMSDRKEFDEAIAVYKKARQVFNNNNLFLLDIPNTYMKAGEYDAAISEWLQLIRNEPGQVMAIQRMLLRYDDPLVYDITILELDDTLQDMPVNDPAYQNLYELQIWLLLENQLFQRAFTSAKEYENKTRNFNFSLFNVGRQLSENNKFELAVDAFGYYRNTSFGEIKWRAMEETADVYLRWADYVDDYQLMENTTRDSLYNEAGQLLKALASEAATYSRIQEIYLMQAELALDHLFDTQVAETALARLLRMQGGEASPQSDYLKGRLSLAERSYTVARLALTRANKQAEGSDLAEKSRYFLALTDFYAGDHEYARIQLKTLGRKNTSYYANDALSLRLWLQKGLATDTTGVLLDQFADAHFNMNHGKTGEARGQFDAILNDTSHPLREDALLMYARLPGTDTGILYQYLTEFLDSNGSMASQREQLMWLRARTTREFYRQRSGTPAADEVVEAFESLILEYPQGFYAPYARTELNQLINRTS